MLKLVSLQSLSDKGAELSITKILHQHNLIYATPCDVTITARASQTEGIG